MIFSLSQDEWLEGQRLYARSLNRLNGVWSVISCLLAPFFIWYALARHDVVTGMVGLVVAWGALDAPVLSRFRLHRRWKRIAPAGVIGWSYLFEEQGFYFRTAGSGNGFSVRWDYVVRRLEGRHVWVLVTKDKTWRLFIIPKSATQTPEGAREWALVEAHFAPPKAPPIASPS